ncbi:hypothetical protein [Gallaecimonas mangrovi]|uniref:hypothetical protein n=1 Tax=Gallaecimonas mangrovi TaxID=2291597 RepID=UPI000E20A06A|nr:hypothetical protein [Gallaecimonas mangrovi]
MSLNLYMKTDKFQSNKGMAEFFHAELTRRGFELSAPEHEDYMYSIESTIDGEVVIFYMGKNDEESSPPLWQVWPEQRIPFLKKLFGKPNKEPEKKAKQSLEEIVNNIEGVDCVEWAI